MGTWRRPALVPGIYDELLSERLENDLRRLASAEFDIVRAPVDPTSPISAPTATLLREALDLALSAHEKDAEKTLTFAREVLSVVAHHAPGTFQLEELWLQLSRLTAIVARNQQSPSRPLGSLHASSLLVNARDASLLEHLRSEFDSADRIDLLCSFVKLSGLEKLRSVLERHCVERGRSLRVLTTTYMGATDARAVERLAWLPNAEVRVSYDRDSTRLHAKAWISTAYVGSSNLSHAAQTEGLEWNVRITANDQPQVLAQMSETFEQYWSDPVLFEPFRSDLPGHRERLIRNLQQNVAVTDSAHLLLELDPKPFQQEVLDELERARALGRHRNLVVAATGTGKTVMAALDYRRLFRATPQQVDSLLFVAHRRELLEQARATFRAALGSQEFGELLLEGASPRYGTHVFASIDSLRDEARLDVSRFDMVIVDEAHHSGAETWTRLLDRVRPKELLGLTGTPERADGIEYGRFFPRPWVGNLRVWNAGAPTETAPAPRVPVRPAAARAARDDAARAPRAGVEGLRAAAGRLSPPLRPNRPRGHPRAARARDPRRHHRDPRAPPLAHARVTVAARVPRVGRGGARAPLPQRAIVDGAAAGVRPGDAAARGRRGAGAAQRPEAEPRRRSGAARGVGAPGPARASGHGARTAAVPDALRRPLRAHARRGSGGGVGGLVAARAVAGGGGAAPSGARRAQRALASDRAAGGGRAAGAACALPRRRAQRGVRRSQRGGRVPRLLHRRRSGPGRPV